MGVNADAESRKHCLCCSQPTWPIQVQWDHMGLAKCFGRKFSFDTNGAGWLMFNFWGLEISIRPFRFWPVWDRERLRPFRNARWEAVLAKEKIEDGRS